MKHTDKQFSDQLKSLQADILKMGSLVEDMIARCVKALVKRDTHLANEVLEQENQVNQLEVEIDEICVQLLALYQPAASDLRFVAAGLKINTDLERMGDLAVNISEQAIKLNQEEPIKPYVDLPLMAEKTQAMVKQALDAFVKRDVVTGKMMGSIDDVVDDLCGKIFDDLTTVIKERPETAERAIRLLMVSRHLERIADHATNIGEAITFMVEGEDIRHGNI